MRALVAGKVGEPTDVLRLESRPVPRPQAGQALVRVKATPIHASDLHVLRGRYGFSPEFPTVGGHMECVGRIEALGPDTEELKTRVPATGGFHSTDAPFYGVYPPSEFLKHPRSYSNGAWVT
jgi:D-arabinose 1-dehydrogenase-like Zn-dependent alcohol dehydrogenase